MFFSRLQIAAGLLASACALSPALAESFKMQGSPVLAHVMVAAAPVLRDQGIEIKVGVEGSSTMAVAMMGDRNVDFALMTRRLTGKDQANFPERELKEFCIGMQVGVFIVPEDVWASGVRSISKAQLQGIYEGQITNWKELGGGDMPIKFFNTERGRGLWELIFTWVYEETRKVPLGKFPITVDGEDARNTVQFTKGGLGIAQINWIDGKTVHGLAIKDEKGEVIEPTLANVAAGKYPLARPAMIVVGETPVGAKKRLIDFLLSPAGQAIVAQSDLVPLKEIAPK
ncbi:MAG: substrate-binding domain-containing protein [Chthoniobacter sp.]|nr:substrate-binding domain-containing protein [Chthoniobacter sp.]